ncbi:hypothetical protein T10_6652 [Trichinella papuae]|uniref:Uncharacterized protein n=1 Tax=Trichinella papuae TaxID=268474 RepID=A0A0V1MHC1_9BILA|nr:hypothetical protein T10_6652 [Trichinella papuae]
MQSMQIISFSVTREIRFHWRAACGPRAMLWTALMLIVATLHDLHEIFLQWNNITIQLNLIRNLLPILHFSAKRCPFAEMQFDNSALNGRDVRVRIL